LLFVFLVLAASPFQTFVGASTYATLFEGLPIIIIVIIIIIIIVIIILYKEGFT
jgi:hypothetical protein